MIIGAGGLRRQGAAVSSRMVGVSVAVFYAG